MNNILISSSSCPNCGAFNPFKGKNKSKTIPEDIRENPKRKKDAEDTTGSFLQSLVCLLAKISKADGLVTTEEIEVVKEFFHNDLKLDDKSYRTAISIFNNAKDSPEPIELYARNVLKNVGNDTSRLVTIANLLFSISTADGHFSAEEEIIINEVETIFNVSGKTEYCKFRNEQKHSQAKSKNSDLKHYEILGLSIESEPAEIKITYRRLVMQYHPDRVQHLGPEFQALAEEKIKEINMAYEYFQRKHSI
jgi:DnaJ like chaperone protein